MKKFSRLARTSSVFILVSEVAFVKEPSTHLEQGSNVQPNIKTSVQHNL